MKRVITWLKNAVAGSRRGIEDVIVSMIPQGVMFMAGLVTSVLIARGLGPEGMGNYALILSISLLVVELSDLGIGQTAIRFASRAAAAGETSSQFAVLRWAFRIRMFLVFITTIIAYIITPLVAQKIWHAPSLTPLVRLSLLTGIFGAIAHVPIIYFQSLKRFKMNSAVLVGQTLITLIGILIIAWLNFWSLELVITASLIASGLGAFTFIFLVPQATFFSVREFGQIIKRKLKFWHFPALNNDRTKLLDDTGSNLFAFFMVLSSIVVMLTMRADIWFMGAFLSKSQIGLYSVATRFTLPLAMVLGALNTALWPRASALTCPQEIIKLLRKTFRISLFIAICGTIYSMFAPFLTPWLFGSAYNGAILLGQVLCLRYCISILTCPVGIIGYNFGLVRYYWWINAIQLLVVVFLNFLLLPRIGAIGSAIALMVNELIGTLIIGFMVWRAAKNKGFVNRVIES